MPFVPDAEAAEAAPQGHFEPDEGMSLSGFGRNAVQDVKQNLSDFGELGQNFMEHPLDTTVAVGKGIIPGAVNEGKRLGVGELLTGHPINAAEKFGRAFYEKPVTTGLEVAPVIGAAGKMLGGAEEAISGAEVAAEAAKAGEGATLGEEAAKTAAEAAPEAAAEPVAAAEGAERASAGIPNQEMPFSDADRVNPNEPAKPNPMDEVKDYISTKYGKVANQPGWSDTVADYLDRYSQNMSVKNLGASPMQAKQLGPDVARSIGKYALDKKITDPFVGEIGMEKKVTGILEDAGKKLGDFRKEADSLRNPKVDPIDVLQQVRRELDPKYARGVHSVEAGSYGKALEEIEDADPSHEGLAQLSTKLNKAANEANRLNQPHGAITDVANTISRINNDRIRAVLGPEKAAAYDDALKTFGVGKKMEQFLVRKGSREVAGRLGPGGAVRTMAQKFLDDVGYKAGAQIASKMSKIIRSNPEMAKSLPSMFQEFVHQIEDLTPPSEPMAKGGIVGHDEMTDFLTSKYTQKEK